MSGKLASYNYAERPQPMAAILHLKSLMSDSSEHLRVGAQGRSVDGEPLRFVGLEFARSDRTQHTEHS